jgi:hypothetical protein
LRTEFLERLKVSTLSNQPPWLFVTSAELAKALGVHIQTLSNWRLRERGPTPAPSTWFKGRPARYNAAHVWAWASEEAGMPATPWRFSAAWLRDYMEFSDWQDRSAVQARVQMLMKLSKAFRPEALTREGREGLMA